MHTPRPAHGWYASGDIVVRRPAGNLRRKVDKFAWETVDFGPESL